MDEKTARRTFGAHLAAMRKRAQLSQSQVAARLCVISGTATLTRNEISRWERGDRLPTAWLAHLAIVLAVPVGQTVPRNAPSSTLWPGQRLGVKSERKGNIGERCRRGPCPRARACRAAARR